MSGAELENLKGQDGKCHSFKCKFAMYLYPQIISVFPPPIYSWHEIMQLRKYMFLRLQESVHLLHYVPAIQGTEGMLPGEFFIGVYLQLHKNVDNVCLYTFICS
jgi:hypothetical protein